MTDNRYSKNLLSVPDLQSESILLECRYNPKENHAIYAYSVSSGRKDRIFLPVCSPLLPFGEAGRGFCQAKQYPLIFN